MNRAEIVWIIEEGYRDSLTMAGRVPWAVLSHGLVGAVALLLLDHVEDSLLGPHGSVIGLATRYHFEVVDKAA